MEDDKTASATSGNAVESASIVSRAAMLRVWRRKRIVMRSPPQPLGPPARCSRPTWFGKGASRPPWLNSLQAQRPEPHAHPAVADLSASRCDHRQSWFQLSDQGGECRRAEPEHLQLRLRLRIQPALPRMLREAHRASRAVQSTLPLVEVAFCRCLPIPIVAPYDGVTRTPLRISLSSSNPSRAACRAK